MNKRVTPESEAVAASPADLALENRNLARRRWVALERFAFWTAVLVVVIGLLRSFFVRQPDAASEKIEPPIALETAGDEAVSAPVSRAVPTFFRLRSLFLTLCILVGIGCRFYGLNWDEGAQLHPDERFLASLVPLIHAPTSLLGTFDSSRSPLNPLNIPDTFYVYGQLPLLLGKIVARFTIHSPFEVFLLGGRVLSALFDCGTVLFTFLIARRLLEREAALIAAALVAGAALHVQQSHFYVVDPFAAFFSTASFWAGVRLVQGEMNLKARYCDVILCGAFFGAALACKISTALFGVALIGFAALLWQRYSPRQTVIFALMMTAAALIAFRLGHPLAFRGEGPLGFFDLRPDMRFWSALKDQGGITRGEVDVPYDVQWIGRKPWLYSLANLGFWGYGWPFLLSGIAGFALLVRRPKRDSVLWVGALFALVLLGVQGAAFSKFSRYFLPLTPFLALLAAYFWQNCEAKWPKIWPASLLVALSATLWSLSVASIYGRPNTRLEASRWMVKNIPGGTIVASETAWDETLPLGIDIPGNAAPASILLDTYDPDTLRKVRNLKAKLEGCEWIVLSSGRSWQGIPRWREKWPVMRQFYRALFDGRLGFRLEKRFASYPSLGKWQFPDERAEEALTVYDHPTVLIFRKTTSYNVGQVDAILNATPVAEGLNWMPKLAPAPDESELPVPPGF